MAELCRWYGISRKTGYKWLRRFEEEGEDGLGERSRAPHRQANRVSLWLEERVCQLREDHSSWGPKKLFVELEKLLPREELPSRATIANILTRNGLSQPRRQRRRASPSEEPLAHAVDSNVVWCIDFKGWFYTGDGSRVDPLTITDAYARYLICLQALRGKTDVERVMAVMKVAFRTYGLPERIRSDNGPPFASTGLAGLSRLSAWWMQLGIVPERIEPGKPQQNGRHERFHRTLKEETASPSASTFNRQQARFRAFRQEYNETRPHEALGQVPPAAVYQGSPRPFPTKLPLLEYPDDMEVRRVRGAGQMKWKGHDVRITRALIGQSVGLLPIEDGLWSVHFCATPIGFFDEQTMRVYGQRAAVPKRKRGRS
jgi:transposase InsO family protein